LFVPSSWLMIGAGFLFGWVGGAILSSLALTLAALLSFVFIRQRLTGSILENRLQAYPYFRSIRQAIGERGPFIVGLLRLTPLPFALGNCLYPLTPLRTGPYLLATWIGLIPGTILFPYLGNLSGTFLQQGLARPHSPWEWILSGFGLVLATVVTFFLSRRAQALLREQNVSVPHSLVHEKTV
jgi:uncharacterized membrane protein YdjX (TVP38/TMEM64 family)